MLTERSTYINSVQKRWKRRQEELELESALYQWWMSIRKCNKTGNITVLILTNEVGKFSSLMRLIFLSDFPRILPSTRGTQISPLYASFFNSNNERNAENIMLNS